MIRHSGPISGVATFQDRYIATAGYDNRLILWDALTDKSIACGTHDHLVNQCQFSPCGKYLVSTSSDYSARLWCVPDMKLHAIFNQHHDDVEGVAFHPEKEIVATTSRDKSIQIYNFNGSLIQTLRGHHKDVLAIVWINSEELMSSSDDGTVKRWHAFDGEVLEDIDLDGTETDTIILCNDGCLYAGNDLGEIIQIIGENKVAIQAHQAGIKRLCYNSRLDHLISLSYDRSMSIWDTSNNKISLITNTRLPEIVWARSADFLGDDKIVIATFGSQYAVYNYKINEWFIDSVSSTDGRNAVVRHNDDVYSIGDSGILFKNDAPCASLPSLCNFIISLENLLITGGQTGEVFEAFSGKVIYQHRSPLNCGRAFLYENMPYVIIGTYTGEALLFSYTENNLFFIDNIVLHDNAIKAISVSSSTIFSVCATGAAAFHSAKDYTLLKYIKAGHDKIANDCAHLFEETFVSVGRDLSLRLTDLGNQKIILTPHKHSIKCVAVSADKQWIATGGYRGTLCIYNLSSKKWIEQRLSYAGISCLYYDELTSSFLASCYDGEIYKISLESLVNFN